MEILQSIVGKPLNTVNRSGVASTNGSIERPEHLVENVNFDGYSLYDFAQTSSAATVPNITTQYRAELVEECEYVYQFKRALRSLLKHSQS